MYKKQSIVIKNFKHFADLRFFVIRLINKKIRNPFLAKAPSLSEIIWEMPVFAPFLWGKRFYLRKYYPCFAFIVPGRHKLYTVI